MANSKAQKVQISWPPRLNLADNRAQIDQSFQNFEKINGPYLNDAISPVWVKGAGENTVFSKDGDAFNLDGGVFKKNGETLWTVDDYKLVKRDVTDKYKKFASWDMNDSHEVALRITNDTYEVWLDGNVISSIGGYSGRTVTESRIRIIGSNIWVVIYYDYFSTERYDIYRYDLSGNRTVYRINQTANWISQRISNGQYSNVNLTSAKDVAPCIHIGKCTGTSYTGISFTMNAGTVENTYNRGFITVFCNDGTSDSYIVGQDILPVMATTTASSRSVNLSFRVNLSNSYSTGSTKTVGIVSASGDANYPVNSLYWYNQGAKYNSSNTYIDGLTSCPIPSDLVSSGVYQGQQSIYSNDGAKSIRLNLYTVVENINTIKVTLTGTTGYNYSITGQSSGSAGTTITIKGGTSYFRAEPLEGSTVTGTGSTWIGVGSMENTKDGSIQVGARVFTYQNEARTQGVSAKVYFVVWKSGRLTPIASSVIPETYVNSESRFTILTTDDGSSQPSSINVYMSYPNIVLDNGMLYSLWGFSPQLETSDNTSITAHWTTATKYQVQGVTCVGNLLSIGNGLFSWTATTSFDPSNIATSCSAIRSNSYVINQNLFVTTGKFNSITATDPAHLMMTGKENVGAKFLEYTYGNRSGLRFNPGTSRLSSFNYYSMALTGDPTLVGAAEDSLVFTVSGYRVPVVFDAGQNSRFNILYNVFQSGYAYTQGISFSSEANRMGTLVTPWQSIDEHSYIAANSSKVVYKDKAGKYFEISVQAGAELSAKVEDRFIVINTTSYWNCYDTKENKKFHYATDYNGRLQHGSNSPWTFSGTLATSASADTPYPYIRYTANGINPLYQVMPQYPITSLLLPIVPRYRVTVGSEISHDSIVDYDIDLQGIDVFYSEQASTTCKYQNTIIPYSSTSNYIKHQLQGTIYPGSTSTSPALTPNVFTEFINGAGNNDIVLDGYDAYTLTYYDNKPYLIYSSSTQVSDVYGKGDAFFVLQGQFYGVIGNKLYSLLYNNGSIAQMDAIIELGDLQFIGNNPLISFWYDPATRVIRSFTGDANMETLYSATKINKYNKSWYDETTQSIFASTDAGLLVFGPKNTYMYENWPNVKNCQFSNDGVTHVTDENGNTFNLKYYEDEGYEVLPLNLESSFWGLGSTEVSTIDRYGITLYDLSGKHKPSYITVGVRSITDCTVKSEEKTYKITPDMFDKFSNSVLVNYNPALIKGQGLRLYLKTPLTIQQITAHVADQGNVSTTRHSM